MRLLVSVRSAAEVDSALAGGADIIDAKEPARGSLGPVTAKTLAGVLARVPSNRAFSVALGDLASELDVASAMLALRLPPRKAPTFLKLGFAGVRSPKLIGRLLTLAVRHAEQMPASPRIVAVAYADPQHARSVAAELVCQSAQSAAAAGVLIDTYRKEGSGLFTWLSVGNLAGLVSSVRAAGLLSAVAGGLGPDDLDSVAAADPDVVGFRGAACEAGRLGEVSAHRVAALREYSAGWSVRAV